MRDFSGAAGFCMLQLRVQKRAAAPTLPVSLSEPLAKSLLDVGDVVVRRQDTSRTGVQVEKPPASILVTCCQAQFERSVSFERLRRVRSVSGESCAWSCGARSRPFRGAKKSMSSLSSSWEAEPGCSRSDIAGFVTLGTCGPAMVCCHASSAAWASMVGPATPGPCCFETVCCQDSSAACAAFWMNRRAVACSSLSNALRWVELAVSMASERGVSRRERACQDCVTDHALDARFGCDEGSQLSRGCDVSRSLELDS